MPGDSVKQMDCGVFTQWDVRQGKSQDPPPNGCASIPVKSRHGDVGFPSSHPVLASASGVSQAIQWRPACLGATRWALQGAGAAAQTGARWPGKLSCLREPGLAGRANRAGRPLRPSVTGDSPGRGPSPGGQHGASQLLPVCWQAAPRAFEVLDDGDDIHHDAELLLFLPPRECLRPAMPPRGSETVRVCGPGLPPWATHCLLGKGNLLFPEGSVDAAGREPAREPFSGL